MEFATPVKGLEPWLELFEDYRLRSIQGGEVVTGRLRAEFDERSPEVRRALSLWGGGTGAGAGGSAEIRTGQDGLAQEVMLYMPRRRGERWWLHAALFALTTFSTMVAGGLLAGRNAIGLALVPLWGGWRVPVPASLDVATLAAGAPFGITLIAILLLHESGHYFAARAHRVSVSPPYFIPFPPYVSIIGTLGAFIRLRSPLLNRRMLLDVGAAGPVVSFLASIPIVWWGLAHSRPVPMPLGTSGPYLVRFMREEIWLGGSPLFTAMAELILESGATQSIHLHPVAFAGWLGLFVTALNLLPISQLDGGHILYALVGGRQKRLALLFFGALLPLGFLWAGWWIWGVLVYGVGRGRVGHPPVFNEQRPLTQGRVAVGAACVVAFVLCFVPIPFKL